MIRITLKSSIKLPPLNKSDVQKILKQSARIIIGDLVNRIDESKSVSGGSLPALESSTVKQRIGKNRSKSGPKRILKRRKVNLNPFQPLVRTGKLRSSFRSKVKGMKARIFLNKNRKNEEITNPELLQILQFDGVGHKNKKFEFFGLSKRAIKEVNQNFEAQIVKKWLRKIS